MTLQTSDAIECEKALEEFPVHEPPLALIRFCGTHGLDILVGGKLKITPPREFNDPFEFAPGIDPNFETHPPTADELRRHFLAKNGLPYHTFLTAWGNGNEARYAEVVERRILRPDLFSKHIQCMRAGITNGISCAYGVACFSAFSADELGAAKAIRHWAAYADDHRGLAIEFDGQHPFFANPAKAKQLFRVDYTDERPICALADFEDVRDPALLRILRVWAQRKSGEAWRCENEWRLIAPLSISTKNPIIKAVSGERLLFFLSLWQPTSPDGRQSGAGQVIRRVILGSRTSSMLEASVRIALNEPHLRHVELCRAIENRSRFALDIIRI